MSGDCMNTALAFFLPQIDLYSSITFINLIKDYILVFKHLLTK